MITHAMKLNWNDDRYYVVGAALQNNLVPRKTYVEIGRELGIHPGSALYIANVALGKIAVAIRMMHGEDPHEIYEEATPGKRRKLNRAKF